MSLSSEVIAARLAALRARLAAADLEGFLLPRADRHQGETAPPGEERLAWATGFTGSVGLALTLPSEAALFVDGRYELQAAAQTDPRSFQPVKLADQEAWAEARLQSGWRIGFDPWLLTAAAVERWRAVLSRRGAELVAVAENPIDALWIDRPGPPTAAAAAHPERLAGESAEAKRARLAEELRGAGLDAAVLTLPESAAWLLNIRGGDLPTTPVVLCFALLHADGAVDLFSDPAKFGDDLRATLGAAVRIRPWEAFESALKALSGRKIAVEKSSAPQAVADILKGAGAEIVWRRDPVSLPRARKNAAEIEGARAAQRRDGAALAEALAWIDAEAPGGRLTELSVAERLIEIRRETAARLGAACKSESFPAIVGFGPNGAVVHYRVTAQSSLPICGDGLLLIDSGAQYADGTTDVTRTLAIGRPSAEMRAVFTLVLKGMIGVSRLIFPPGAAGRDLDAVARAALWRAGLDYDHGTGHGVGSYLGVHEGPQSLSRRGEVPLESGMILSNEPGCYRPGRFGVRIENLILVEQAGPVASAGPAVGERPMRRFETLTLAPIDRRLIDPALLSAEERAWLDAYHARVAAEIAPLVTEPTAAWLAAACAPL